MKNNATQDKTPKQEEPRLQQKECEVYFNEDRTIADLVAWATAQGLDPAAVTVSAYPQGDGYADLCVVYARTETEEEYATRIADEQWRARVAAEAQGRRVAQEKRDEEIRKLEAKLKKLKGV